MPSTRATSPAGKTVNDRLAEILGRDEPFQSVCDALVAEANAEGGPDNITALVLQVDAD